VWLGDATGQHYYVLSRFLLARMLTAAKVPKKKATQIMLELKKKLVDEERLDISQKQLEEEIFSLLRQNGYGEEYIECFGMITSFYHLKIPLIVLICGTACVCKSIIATRLAEELNLPNVLQTDLFAQVIRMSEDSPICKETLWERNWETTTTDPNRQEELEEDDIKMNANRDQRDTERHQRQQRVDNAHSDDEGNVLVLDEGNVLQEFKRECACLRRSVEGDLYKSMKDGKSIILEGTYLDPAMFASKANLFALEEIGQTMTQTRITERERESHHHQHQPHRSHANADAAASHGEEEEPYTCFAPPQEEEGNAKRETSSSFREPQNRYDPIIVPIVLAMGREDHLDLLDQWMEYSMPEHVFNLSESDRRRQREKVHKTLEVIQTYYAKYATKHQLKMCYVKPMMIQQTVDDIHSHLLQCITRSMQQYNTNAK
jgi:2-phosphoglycerate kinase